MRATLLCIGLGLLTALTNVSAADNIKLKDSANITGEILAEKDDQIVVDVGYTVLIIPRDQVSSITRGDSASEPVLLEPEFTQTPSDLYITATNPLPERDVRDLVKEIGEAVVQVKTPGGLGSGFLINEEGYLITNFHVIEGETEITVEVYHQVNGRLERHSYKNVRIVAMNKFEDLTLLKIDDVDRPKFKVTPLGSLDELQVGEEVFAIGSPLGLERTVTEGIISTKTRQVEGSLYLQTSTQINPGNSGGPLFNMRGEVIGVTNMKLSSSGVEGLGFAIPVAMVKFFLENRDAYAYDSDNPSTPYRYLDPPGKVYIETQEE